jgi:hypothetical protein
MLIFGFYQGIRLRGRCVMKNLAQEYRAWERLLRDQARAGTELARKGLEESARQMRSSAECLERKNWWSLLGPRRRAASGTLSRLGGD